MSKLGLIPANLDIGFTDLLRPGGGVGSAAAGACSLSAGTLVVSIAGGGFWIPDNNGSGAPRVAGGILNSLVRLVYAGGSQSLNAQDPTNPRVDILVLTINGGWGSQPFVNSRTGTPTAGADALNMLGAGALVPGDIPLCAIRIPAGISNFPTAFSFGSHGGNSANANDLRCLAADLTPIGVTKPHAGSLVPVGYKLCDFTALSRTKGGLDKLFAELSTAHGTGDGTNTFNLPDMLGRVAVGVGTATGAAGATAHTLAQKAGEETHLLSGPESGVQAHTHPPGPGTTSYVGNAAGGSAFGAGSSWAEASTTGSAGPTNAASAHINMQPYLGLNHIVKI